MPASKRARATDAPARERVVAATRLRAAAEAVAVLLSGPVATAKRRRRQDRDPHLDRVIEYLERTIQNYTGIMTMVVTLTYRPNLVIAQALLQRSLGHPECPVFVACSELHGVGLFAARSLPADHWIAENGGDVKTASDTRKQTEPRTHVRDLHDASGDVRDGISWRAWLSPQFTAEQHAAELLRTPLERTRVTIDPALVNVPGVSPQLCMSSADVP